MVRSTALPPSTQRCDSGGGCRNQRATEPPEFGFNLFQTNPQDSAANVEYTETNLAQVHAQRNWRVNGVLSTKRDVTAANWDRLHFVECSRLCSKVLSTSKKAAISNCLKIFSGFNNPSAYFRDERSGRYKGGKRLPRAVQGNHRGRGRRRWISRCRSDLKTAVAAATMTVLSDFDGIFTLKLPYGTSLSC